MTTMLLNAPALREGKRDILRWIVDTSRSFSVASAYRWSQLCHRANSKTVEFIWKNVSPPKLCSGPYGSREINDCLFNSAQADVESLCDSIKVRIALWIKSSCPAVVYSVNKIVHHLQQLVHIG
ncbi:hypothetical protein ACSBR2_025984 [Camellia fascicularis]